MCSTVVSGYPEGGGHSCETPGGVNVFNSTLLIRAQISYIRYVVEQFVCSPTVQEDLTKNCMSTKY